MIRDVRAAYERFEFYRVYQRIYQFCSVELSSFYLDVLKDRLYAEAPDGPDRRAAQFVLARLHDVLTRLLAPIIPHTAEELWDFLPDRAEQARERPPGRVARARPGLGRRRPRRAAGRRCSRSATRSSASWRSSARPRSSAAPRRRRSSVGSDDPASAALLERDRDLLPTLAIVSEVDVGGAMPADAARGRRPARALGPGAAVAARQVRAVLEPPAHRRPDAGAPDALRPLRAGRDVTCGEG